MKRMTLPLLLCIAFTANGQVGVGKWRDCLDYSRVEHVEPAGEWVYAAARNGIFRYDTLYGTIERLNRITGLSDMGVTAMAYDPLTRCVAMAYANSNIDLLVDGKVYNLSDIKRSEISGDKSIYNIRFHNGMAYLATGFGIVVVDVARHEIKETCYIGNGGAYTVVRALAFGSDSLYAATGEGLKRISLGEPHIGISDRWTTDHRLAGVTVTMLDCADGKILAGGYTYDPEQIDLYCLQGTAATRWNSGMVRTMRAGGGRITVTHEVGIAVYDTQLQRLDTLAAYDWGALACFDAVCSDTATLWAGHEWGGLFRIRTSGNTYLMPDGPFSQDNVYRIVAFGNRTMICPGGHTTTYANAYINSNLPTCVGNTWRSYSDAGGLLSGVTDLLDAAVNPYDTAETVVAFWGTGLASLRNNEVQQVYNSGNTDGALQPYDIGGFSTLRTGAVQFDRSGNLWVLVSNSSSALAMRSADGNWHRFNTSALASEPSVDKLVCDSITGYLWFCGRDNVIYVHDGKDRMARVNPNNGSKLSTDAVNALVQDRTGNLWIGTNKGIKVIYDGYNAFRNGGNGESAPVNCSNITITNGEFYEYLMAYESITTIAVDGANRKWVGTSSGGLYLLSANGLEQLQHFTAENSPLFSNKIIALAVQPVTGEVFVGTDRGVQTYRSTATYAESWPDDEVYAFPNPVRPDYDGPIAIKGFTRDGLVHITDAAGHTVFTTRAQGGQAIWYGRNLDGKPVASGVYYVFAADAEGSNRSVAKILIVR